MSAARVRGDVYLVVGIFEFRDGKIFRETRYYPQPFEPPEWQAQWVELMEEQGPRES